MAYCELDLAAKIRLVEMQLHWNYEPITYFVCRALLHLDTSRGENTTIVYNISISISGIRAA